MRFLSLNTSYDPANGEAATRHTNTHANTHTEQDAPAPEAAPPISPTPPTERAIWRSELIISFVLRGGVLLSAALMVIGLLSLVLTRNTAMPEPSSVASFVHAVLTGEPLALMTLGLLVLLLTPVLRVVVALITFAWQRDWRFTLITAIVLCVLLLSVLLGRGGA
jgi:uncharacterized membrane protein